MAAATAAAKPRRRPRRPRTIAAAKAARAATAASMAASTAKAARRWAAGAVARADTAAADATRRLVQTGAGRGGGNASPFPRLALAFGGFAFRQADHVEAGVDMHHLAG